MLLAVLQENSAAGRSWPFRTALFCPKFQGTWAFQAAGLGSTCAPHTPPPLPTVKAHSRTEVWSSLGTNLGERTLPAAGRVMGKSGEVLHATAHRLQVLGGLSSVLTPTEGRSRPSKAGDQGLSCLGLGHYWSLSLPAPGPQRLMAAAPPLLHSHPPQTRVQTRR